jgi:predicted RNase H-like HicB family nuclease
MQLRIIIEYDKVVNAFSAVCPELPGCTSCGDTEEEALQNIKEAIDLYLEPDPNFMKDHVNAKVYELAV